MRHTTIDNNTSKYIIYGEKKNGYKLFFKIDPVFSILFLYPKVVAKRQKNGYKLIFITMYIFYVYIILILYFQLEIR